MNPTRSSTPFFQSPPKLASMFALRCTLTYVTQQNQTSGAMANPLIGRQEVAMNPEFVADIKRKHKAGRIAGSWWVKTDN